MNDPLAEANWLDHLTDFEIGFFIGFFSCIFLLILILVICMKESDSCSSY